MLALLGRVLALVLRTLIMIILRAALTEIRRIRASLEASG